jgi:hypothetical protein
MILARVAPPKQRGPAHAIAQSRWGQLLLYWPQGGHDSYLYFPGTKTVRIRVATQPT